MHPKPHRSQSVKTMSPGAHICRTKPKKKSITNQPSPLRLVLETLTPLPTTRKCFRMINGVLVERTVGDVLPQLQSNSDNMNKVLVELAKQYKTKQDDMEKWKVRYFLSCSFHFLSFLFSPSLGDGHSTCLRKKTGLMALYLSTEKEQDPGRAAVRISANVLWGVCLMGRVEEAADATTVGLGDVN
jgi:hypothetical protein